MLQRIDILKVLLILLNEKTYCLKLQQEISYRSEPTHATEKQPVLMFTLSNTIVNTKNGFLERHKNVCELL